MTTAEKPRTARHFPVGSRVEHPSFGLGTIREFTGSGRRGMSDRMYHYPAFDSGAIGTTRTRVTPIVHEGQEASMSATESTPKPPAKRTRSQSAAAARAKVAPPVAPTGPSQADVDDATVALAAELDGTVSDDVQARVAARATEVKAEQDAAPPKAKRSNEAQAAKRKAQDERIARVIEMRKAGKSLREIAEAEGYTSQQVVSSTLRRHAPDLQVKREATGGFTLTDTQADELLKLESKYGARLNTLAAALRRHENAKG